MLLHAINTENHFESFNIKFIRRDQKQCRNDEACRASSACFWSRLIKILTWFSVYHASFEVSRHKEPQTYDKHMQFCSNLLTSWIRY